MNCPYCNEMMEEGIIQDQHEINWLPKDAKFKFLGSSLFHKGSLVLSEFSFLKGSSVVAYRCDRCKKIIIDYSQNNCS